MSPPSSDGFEPDRRKAKTEEWHEYISDEDRFTWREVRNGQRQLIDFSLSQWHRVDPDGDDCAEIARVDAHHGEIHRHSFRADGSQAVRRKYCDITGYQDFIRGRDYAEKTIIGRCDQNLRCWEYGDRKR